MTAPSMWQTARQMLALGREEQPGCSFSVDLGAVSESQMIDLVRESGVDTNVQPSGSIIGGILESLHWTDGRADIRARCSRAARPGDERKVRR